MAEQKKTDGSIQNVSGIILVLDVMLIKLIKLIANGNILQALRAGWKYGVRSPDVFKSWLRNRILHIY